MSRRPPATSADYMIVAINPALIMMLVGSVLFFLCEVFYRGQYEGRLTFICAMYVMGIVAVSRISMEEGTGYAAGFGAPLAAVVYIAFFKFVEFHGPLAALSPLLNAVFLIFTWWLAYNLTWDCTLLDDTADASGQGLLEAAGFDAVAGDAANGGAAPAANASSPVPAAPERPSGPMNAAEKLLAEREKYERDRTEPPSFFTTWFEADRRPRAQGVWVLWFAAIALPIFGVMQWFVPSDQWESRVWCLQLLLMYVGSSLALLLNTSFLSLRRYLRQRKLEMPLEMAGVWMIVGAALIGGVMLFCLVLPRPGAEVAISQPPITFGNSGLNPSSWGMGNDGKKQQGGSGQSQTNQQQGSSSSSSTSSQGSQSAGSKSQPSQSQGSQGQASQGQSSSGAQSSGGSSPQNPPPQQNSSNASSGSKPPPNSAQQNSGQPNSPQQNSQQAPTKSPSESGQQNSAQSNSGQQSSGQPPMPNSNSSQPNSTQPNSPQPNSSQPNPAQQNGSTNPAAKSPESGSKSPGSQEGNKGGEKSPAGQQSGNNPDSKSSSNNPSSNDPSKGDPSKSEPGKNDPSKTDATGNKSPEAGKTSPGDPAKTNQSGNSGATSSQSNNSQPQQSNPQSSSGPSAQPPTPPRQSSFRLPSVQLPASLGNLLKLLLWAAIAVGIVYCLIRYREQIAAAWKQLLDELAKLWARLFGGGEVETAAAEAAATKVVTPPRPFASYPNPFATGLANRMPPPQLMGHTLAAAEAFGRERGFPRDESETPHEYLTRLFQQSPEVVQLALAFAETYGQVAFGGGAPPQQAHAASKRLWQVMSSTPPPPPPMNGARLQTSQT
jgi:hypothetical protein